ncbi:MAG: hypothetical protein PVH65_03085 [Chloroflexota bacterium]
MAVGDGVSGVTGDGDGEGDDDGDGDGVGLVVVCVGAWVTLSCASVDVAAG